MKLRNALKKKKQNHTENITRMKSKRNKPKEHGTLKLIKRVPMTFSLYFNNFSDVRQHLVKELLSLQSVCRSLSQIIIC